MNERWLPVKGYENYYHISSTGRLKAIPHNAQLTLDMKTGVFYYSIKEASKFIGVKHTTLLAQLKGVNKNKTSLIIV